MQPMAQSDPNLMNEIGGLAGLTAIADLLACPRCRAKLVIEADALRCTGCRSQFPIEDGLPLLAVHGTSETWGQSQPGVQSAEYQAEFQRVERAATFNLQYRRKFHKRLTTRREYALIGRHMRRVGRSRVVLDLPCGGGRLTPAIADSTDFVIEADIAIGQLLFGRSQSTVATPRVWMTASAFHIPLRDNAVDGAICVRLAHHLPTLNERERLVQELLRVSQRFVIMTFFDHYSLKNLSRRMRHPFNRKPPKLTMTKAAVADLARKHGGRLISAPALSLIGSGHRYALIVKNGVRK